MIRLLTVSILAALAAFGRSQDFGPIETRNLRSLSVPFFRFTLRDPVAPRGRGSWAIGFDAANDARFRSTGARHVDEDYEMDRLSVQYRLGLGNDWDLTVEGQLLHRGHGGTLDAFVDGWHRFFHIQQDREGHPYGESFVEIPGHPRYNSATSLGDVSVMGTRAFNPQLSASVAMKIPVGSSSDLLGSGGWDAGADLNWTVPISPRKHLVLQAGLVYQGPSPELPEARRWIPQQALSFIYRWSATDSLVFQWQNESSAIVTGVADSDARHSITTYGYQKRIDSRRLLQFFICEDGDWFTLGNFKVAGVGPDFTVGLRYILRF